MYYMIRIFFRFHRHLQSRWLKYISFILCLTGVAVADISVSARVDKSVASLQEGVRLEVTVEGSQNARAPQIAQLPGFRIVRGPATSRSMQIINGVQSLSLTFTYILAPEKPGTHSLGPFTVYVEGREYTSAPVTIEVLEGSAEAERTTLFATLEVCSTNTYVHSQILATLTLYYRDITVSGVDHPAFDFSGFTIHDVGQPVQERRAYNNVIYNTVRFQKILVPQRAGSMTLGPIPITVQIQKRVEGRRRSPFGDDFFNDSLLDSFFGSVAREEVVIQSDRQHVVVAPLPTQNRPDDFTDGVGIFTMDTSVSPTSVSVGEPITLHVTIRGRGAIDPVTPHFSEYDDFRSYPPEVRRSSHVRNGQLMGEKTFTKVWIPTTDSLTEIPPVSLTFFNPFEEQYETLSRGPFPIEVAPAPDTPSRTHITDARTRTPPEQRIRVLSQDLFPIISAHDVRSAPQRAYLSALFYATIGIPFIIWAYANVRIAQRKRRANDIVALRKRFAAKNARTRLYNAERALKEKNLSAFYASVADAVSLSIADLMNIPRSHVSADEITHILAQTSVPDETIQTVKDILHTCDFARFTGCASDTEKARNILHTTQKSLTILLRSLS